MKIIRENFYIPPPNLASLRLGGRHFRLVKGIKKGTLVISWTNSENQLGSDFYFYDFFDGQPPSETDDFY